jgi:phage terminase large subunit
VEKELWINDIYIPLLHVKTRKLVLYGGSGSGKSVFASQKTVLRILTEKGHKILCLRKVGETIKESIFAELKRVISDFGCLHEFDINKTDKSFLHRPTGNQIICKGLDEPEKIKSISGITSMWIEEATEFTSDEIDQLELRVRGEKPNYVQFILSFNPISEDNLIVKRFVIDKTDKDCFVLHTTHLDNHFLSEADRQVLYNLKERNPLFYDIYCLGIPGVVDKSGKFLYTFDANKQVIKGLSITDTLPLWVTFDFNIDPMTVSVAQRIDHNTLFVLKSLQLPNSDIHAMCDRINTEFHGYYLIATGDASGANETGVVRGKSSYWKVIKSELGLTDAQLHIRSKNLGLIESRVLCNVVNQTMGIFFDEEGCAPLITECKYAKVDDRGVLIKDRNKQKNDFLDGHRYLLDANWPDILNKPQRKPQTK